MIYTKQQVQDAFQAACKTRDEFDAVEYVAQTLALPPEVVAEVVGKVETV